MIRRLVQRKRRPPVFAGNCDGQDGRELYGWAWRPGAPDTRVEVELWVDGVLAFRTVADQHRADLKEAGVGDGFYGWRLPLALDPDKAEPQKVEVRIVEGGPLPNGLLEVTYAPPAPEEAAASESTRAPQGALKRAEETLDPAVAWGLCDGRDGAIIHGWAWRPAVPEQHVIVEQWVAGTLVDQKVADRPRADLFDAEIGHGSYGWSMRLRLDPEKPGRQAVELRIRGGGLLVNGRFELTRDEIEAAAAPVAEGATPEAVVGRCDGLKGAALYGWAWNPSRPDESVEVELWVDGARVATCVADGFRPDLRSNRVGHGRYGWRLPLELPPAGAPALHVEVRDKDGAPLSGGVMELANDLSLDDPANAAWRPFVETVLQPGARATAKARLTSLLYCPEPARSGKFWAREYDDYPAALKAFAPALAKLGKVVVVKSIEAAWTVCAKQRGQGRDCILFSFGSPRQAPLHAPCPVVPVFAWGFPTIPTGTWDGDQCSDWRRVLRFTGQAITFSRFAAEAVQAAMGADFPVAAIPPPARTAATATPPDWRRTIRLKGMVFDSRAYEFQPENPTLPQQVWDGGGAVAAGEDVEIEGMLVTSFLDVKDGRKNWKDLVSAFTTANQDKADAVLLLKLSEPDAAWMQLLYKWLAAQPRFACRILAVRAPLEDQDYDALIAASHWYATAANAEGLRLPMQDFLAAGRPAISPAHTAMADGLDATNALVVASDEEPWSWPCNPPVEDGWSWTQHPDDIGPTTAYRVSWTSLVAAFREAYRLSTAAPEAYAALSAAASRSIAASCSVAETAAAVKRLLAQGGASVSPGPGPSPLLREIAAG